MFTTGVERIEFRVPNIVGDGDVVLTERVDVFVLPNKTIELPVMGTFEVRDGKIAAWRDYFDLNQYMQQLPRSAPAEHGADGLDRVGLGGGLVVAVAADPREAERDAAGVAAGRLHAVERDLDDLFGAHVHDVAVFAGLQLQEAFGLPREQLVGEALERLADHHEVAVLAARAEVQVRQPAPPPAAAPLDGEHDEVERA